MNSILIVDTDGKALSDLQRRLRKKFTTHIALGPRLGLQRIQEEGPFALVLAEFSMSEMDGVDFMAKAGELCPESTRVLYSRANGCRGPDAGNQRSTGLSCSSRVL
jgi:DNA-binding NtrC family response regulator